MKPDWNDQMRLLKIFRGCKNLERLVVVDIPLEPDVIAAIPPTVRSLTLRDSIKDHAESFERIAAMKHLKSLDITNCKIGPRIRWLSKTNLREFRCGPVDIVTEHAVRGAAPYTLVSLRVAFEGGFTHFPMCRNWPYFGLEAMLGAKRGPAAYLFNRDGDRAVARRIHNIFAFYPLYPSPRR